MALTTTAYNIDGEWCILSAKKCVFGLRVDFESVSLAQHMQTPVLCTFRDTIVFYHPATNYLCPIDKYLRVQWSMDGVQSVDDLPSLRAKYATIDLQL